MIWNSDLRRKCLFSSQFTIFLHVSFFLNSQEFSNIIFTVIWNSELRSKETFEEFSNISFVEIWNSELRSKETFEEFLCRHTRSSSSMVFGVCVWERETKKERKKIQNIQSLGCYWIYTIFVRERERKRKKNQDSQISARYWIYTVCVWEREKERKKKIKILNYLLASESTPYVYEREKERKKEKVKNQLATEYAA